MVKTQEITNLQGYQIVLQLPEISILSPLRRKLNFVIAADTNQTPLILLTKSIDDPSIAPDLIINDLSESNIRYAVVLPVPEKKNHKYLAIFYKHNYKDSHKNEPLLMQLNFEILEPQWGFILEQLNFTSLIDYLTKQFKICGFDLQDPFHSSGSFFVEAHIGSKEGTLYFLPNYIIFGFKKPILCLELKEIESITYTSITRVTFNVTIVLKDGGKQEFSMIDQEEYEKINQYVQEKEYKDQSMAEEQKLQVKGQSHESVMEEVMEEESDDEEEDENYQFGGEESGSASGSDVDSEGGSDDSDLSDDDVSDDEGSGGSDNEEESGESE